MTVRSYALVLLLSVALLPLSVFGFFTIRESRRATDESVSRANTELAKQAAFQVSRYMASEKDKLHILGKAIATSNPEVAEKLAEGALIDAPYLHNLTVLDTTGRVRTQAPSVGYTRPPIDPSKALEGTVSWSSLRPADPNADGPFAHSISLALPIHVVGAHKGVLLVDMDLVSLWEPINAISVGKEGAVRLLAGDGTVLAHGNPNERRDVFSGTKRLDVLDAARRGASIQDGAGTVHVTAHAQVPGRDWHVVVEQPFEEAHALSSALKSRLLWLIGAAALLSIAVALWAGRGLVRGFEDLHRHARSLADGTATQTGALASPIHELKDMGASLNTLASDLTALHQDARDKERITTFGRVAAGLAHDLRLPTESLEEACRIVRENRDDPGAWSYFETAVDSELPKLRTYLDDLKHLAAEGRMGLHLERVEPRSFLEAIADRLAPLPKWRGIDFVVEGSAADIEADTGLLRRAVANLAANGADAMVQQGEGIVVLRARDRETAEGDAGLVIDVIDEGTGMSEETLGHVLRGDFHSTKRANGVGLGVGVARHIVESHGGQLGGHSMLGEGTTMTLWLPRSPTTGPDSPQRGNGAPADGAVSSTRKHA